MNVLAFDIETVPDVETGRQLHGLEGMSDADVARVLAMKRREQTGESEFLRHHLHRIVAIAAVLRRYTPTLVSWNGGGFDLPVLHYRALKHGISAPRYWETGADDQSFRFNNYLNRFHERHTDLMDVLSNYQARATAPLDEIAVLLGLPGKMGRSGASVWDQFLDGKIEEIRDYCETDALNTYLIYLRFELMRGNLDHAGWERECEMVRSTIEATDRAHWRAFLGAWKR